MHILAAELCTFYLPNRNLAGRLNEHQFARLLDEAGVIELQRLHSDHDADASDMGRKWRAALMQLGFITPGEKVLEQLRRRERQFTVTPNGRRLLEASTLLEEQECFSRALLAHQIPSPVEGFIEPVFSPLRIVLEVIAALEKSGLDPRVSMDEMACLFSSHRALPISRRLRMRLPSIVSDWPA